MRYEEALLKPRVAEEPASSCGSGFWIHTCWVPEPTEDSVGKGANPRTRELEGSEGSQPGGGASARVTPTPGLEFHIGTP